MELHSMKKNRFYMLLNVVALLLALALVGICCYYAFAPEAGTVNDLVLILMLAVSVIVIYITPQLLLFEGATIDDKFVVLKRCSLRPRTVMFRCSDVRFSTAVFKKRLFGMTATLQFRLNDGELIDSSPFFIDEKSWPEFEQYMPNYFIERRAKNMRPKYDKNPVSYDDNQSTFGLLAVCLLVLGAFYLYSKIGM